MSQQTKKKKKKNKGKDKSFKDALENVNEK